MSTILLTGATGQLGPFIARRLLRDGHNLVLWSQSWKEAIEGITPRCVDLEDEGAMRHAFAQAAPDAIIHAAAMSQIAACHADPAKAQRVNVDSTALLASRAPSRQGGAKSAQRSSAPTAAKADKATGARSPMAPPCRDGALIYLSTDLVFDGEQGGYRETDVPTPVNVYGRTKLEAESHVLALDQHTVLRLPLIISPSLVGRPKFFEQLTTSLREGKPVTLFDDEWRAPLTAEDVAQAVALALTHRVTGLFHLAGPQRLSRYEIGVAVARGMGLDPAPIRRASRLSMQSPEPRPRDTSLNGEKWLARFPAWKPRTIEEAARQWGEASGGRY